MKRLQPATKYLASLFLVLTLHSLMLGFLEPRAEVISAQHMAHEADSIVAADSYEQELLNFFKPPKNSFIDYSSFFDPRCLIPIHDASTVDLVAIEPLAPWLKVYLEIFVPPDCSA